MRESNSNRLIETSRILRSGHSQVRRRTGIVGLGVVFAAAGAKRQTLTTKCVQAIRRQQLNQRPSAELLRKHLPSGEFRIAALIPHRPQADSATVLTIQNRWIDLQPSAQMIKQ